MISILFTCRNPGVISIIILFFLNFINISSSSSTKSLPEIWLSSYEDTDSYQENLAETEFRTLDQFDNQLIIKFNATDYIVQDDVRLAVFTCQAKYPVMWSIPHLKQIEKLSYYMLESSSSRESDFSQDENPVPRNKLFQSILTIRFDYTDYFFSVNFTCGDIDNSKGVVRHHQIFSSIHLYYTGKHEIENPGSTDQVYVSPSKEMDTIPNFILPCRPATPNVQILLEKQIDTPNDSGMKTKWKQFKYPSKYVNFDPKVGFIMDKNPMGKRSMIFGLYKCTAIMDEDKGLESGQEEKNNQQFKYVNVTSFNDPNIIDLDNIRLSPELSLKGEALVKYDQNIFHKLPVSSSLNKSLQSYDDSEFVCCSGKVNTRPMIFLDYCKDHLQCELLKWSMAVRLQADKDNYLNYISYDQNGDGDGFSKECGSVYLQNSQVIFCKGENVNFTNSLVTIFNKDVWPVLERLEKRRANKKRSMYLSTFQTEDSEMNDISRKIFLTIGYPISNLQLDEDMGRYYDQIDYLNIGEIVLDDMNIDYFDEISSREVRRRTEALTKKLAEYPRDHFYTGEVLIPICLGWSSFYSDGAYVGVTFKNGTKKIINLNKEAVKTEVYFVGGLRINDMWAGWKQLVHKFGRNMIAHKDMAWINCWMPQWNTAIWDNMSRNLTILDPIAPTFYQDDYEEYVYFYLGEQSKDLEWTVVGGLPESRIDVTKDGRGILKRLTSNLENLVEDDEENVVEHPFEKLFNVTLENDNGTTVEDGNGITTVVKIRFVQKITHEMQGVYVCTAENVGGKVRRVFRVVVAERRNIAILSILLATIVSSLVLVAGMGYRLYNQRKQLQSN